MRRLHLPLAVLALGALAAASVMVVARRAVERAAAGRVVGLADAPTRRVGIVFGAAVGSQVLRDRVETGVALYRAGKVQHLLLSGDNRRRSYDEPWAMRRLALEAGVPREALVLDYAGRRTYDSCARARDIFRVDGALLVTQEFHLGRAIYLCRALGLDVVGVAADRQPRAAGLRLAGRELLANVRAFLDVHVRAPPVVGGSAEPIEPDGGEPALAPPVEAPGDERRDDGNR